LNLFDGGNLHISRRLVIGLAFKFRIRVIAIPLTQTLVNGMLFEAFEIELAFIGNRQLLNMSKFSETEIFGCEDLVLFKRQHR